MRLRTSRMPKRAKKMRALAGWSGSFVSQARRTARLDRYEQMEAEGSRVKLDFTEIQIPRLVRVLAKRSWRLIRSGPGDRVLDDLSFGCPKLTVVDVIGPNGVE